MQDLHQHQLSNSTQIYESESFRPFDTHLGHYESHVKEGILEDLKKADLSGLVNLEVRGRDRTGARFKSINEVWSSVLDLADSKNYFGQLNNGTLAAPLRQ